jgi:hypothetical protein
MTGTSRALDYELQTYTPDSLTASTLLSARKPWQQSLLARAITQMAGLSCASECGSRRCVLQQANCDRGLRFRATTRLMPTW